MLKTLLLCAALAIILAAAAASPFAADRAYLQSTAWQDHWLPCFKNYPTDRTAAMRGLDGWIEINEKMRNATDRLPLASNFDDEDDAKVIQEIFEEIAAIKKGAKMNEVLDDFKLVANHGCVPAQAMTAEVYGMLQKHRGVEGTEWLKWMMLAGKSGMALVQSTLKENIWKYSAEDIAKARMWADAWRPSD